MCGRYYVDDDTAREIEKLVRQVNEQLKSDITIGTLNLVAKDIHPTEMAPVLTADHDMLTCAWKRWGLPSFQGKQVIFNARSESAMSKPSFREGIRNRRIVIPATWFYEWNHSKEKHVFTRKDAPILFMAGCYNKYEDGDRFVILTTAANESMQPVHDRMPLILERNEIYDWIFKEDKTEDILRKTPCLLRDQTDYEQLSLF